MARRKYVLDRNDRKHLMVSKDMHLTLKAYCAKHNITLAEAVQELLANALVREEKVEE